MAMLSQKRGRKYLWIFRAIKQVEWRKLFQDEGDRKLSSLVAAKCFAVDNWKRRSNMATPSSLVKLNNLPCTKILAFHWKSLELKEPFPRKKPTWNDNSNIFLLANVFSQILKIHLFESIHGCSLFMWNHSSLKLEQMSLRKQIYLLWNKFVCGSSIPDFIITMFKRTPTIFLWSLCYEFLNALNNCSIIYFNLFHQL